MRRAIYKIKNGAELQRMRMGCDSFAQVHSIMRHTAETLEVELETVYKAIGWPLYRLYGHAFEAFKLMISDQDAVIKRLETFHGGTIPDFTPKTLVTPERDIFITVHVV